MTLSIDIQHNSIECHYAECRYAGCHDNLNVMLSVIMLNVVMLSVIRLNVVMLSVIAEKNTLAYNTTQIVIKVLCCTQTVTSLSSNGL